jgi:hypothetical protein
MAKHARHVPPPELLIRLCSTEQNLGEALYAEASML